MKTLSHKITIYLIDNDILSKDKYDWAIYYFQKKIFCTICLLFIISICSFTFPIDITLIYIATFLKLRQHTGGYHCNNYIQCFFLSIIISYITIYAIINTNISSLKYIIILLFAAIYIIFKYAPVNHINIHLNKQEYEALKQKMKIVVKFLLSLSIFILFINKTYFICIIYSFIVDAVLILLSIQLKQYI